MSIHSTQLWRSEFDSVYNDRKCADAVAAVGLDTALGKDVIGHLLFLLLDRDHSGTVPSEQALENLYEGFNFETPQDIKILNDAVCYILVIRLATMSLCDCFASGGL